MKDSTKLTIGLIIVALGILWPKIKEGINLPDDSFTSVSYTHLTLPTKRIV